MKAKCLGFKDLFPTRIVFLAQPGMPVKTARIHDKISRVDEYDGEDKGVGIEVIDDGDGELRYYSNTVFLRKISTLRVFSKRKQAERWAARNPMEAPFIYMYDVFEITPIRVQRPRNSAVE